MNRQDHICDTLTADEMNRDTLDALAALTSHALQQHRARWQCGDEHHAKPPQLAPAPLATTPQVVASYDTGVRLPKALITVIAALASGRGCLTFDNEGAARLTLDLSQPEAAKLATALPSLMDTALAIAIQPVNG